MLDLLRLCHPACSFCRQLGRPASLARTRSRRAALKRSESQALCDHPRAPPHTQAGAPCRGTGLSGGQVRSARPRAVPWTGQHAHGLACRRLADLASSGDLCCRPAASPRCAPYGSQCCPLRQVPSGSLPAGSEASAAHVAGSAAGAPTGAHLGWAQPPGLPPLLTHSARRRQRPATPAAAVGSAAH